MQNLLGEIIVSYSRIGFPKTNYIVRNSQKSFKSFFNPFIPNAPFLYLTPGNIKKP